MELSYTEVGKAGGGAGRRVGNQEGGLDILILLDIKWRC